MSFVLSERTCKVLDQRSKTKEEVIFQAYFHCPKCHGQRAYDVKPASIEFTFYYLPIFEKVDLDNFIVCQVCKRGFDPLILKRSNQSLFKLVGATKFELMNSSPGALKLKLMNDGLKEKVIDKLIALAQS
jgi:hypothetical protein